MSPKKVPATEKPKPQPIGTETSEQESKDAKRYIYIMVGVMAAMVIVGGFIIFRLVTTYSREANKIKAQDIEIKLLNQKQKDLEALKPNYATITAKNSNGVSDADLILRALPIDTDFKGLIASLEKMAQQSGIKISSVSQTGDTSATSTGEASNSGSGSATPQPLGFTVAVEGSYQGLLDFLKKTEISSRVINFSSMTLSGGSGQPIQADLIMKTYWQPPANIEPTTEPLKWKNAILPY